MKDKRIPSIHLFSFTLWMFLVNIWSVQTYAQSKDSIQLNWQVMGQKMVSIFTADPRAPRLCFERNFDQTSYTAGMGGFFPLLTLKKGKFHSQLSASGVTYLTLARNNQAGSVQNVDFFGDLLMDTYLHKNWILRLGTGHTSQHLSDDAILAGAPFKNYAKDFHQVMLVYQNPNLGLNVYGGFAFHYNFKTYGDISNKFQFQLGFEHIPFVNGKAGLLKHFYYASDIKFRQENNYKNTLNIQTGFRYSNPSQRILRLAMNYSSGVDERGYYQPAIRNFYHLGIYLDF